jgi:hypothetical protein
MTDYYEHPGGLYGESADVIEAVLKRAHAKRLASVKQTAQDEPPKQDNADDTPTPIEEPPPLDRLLDELFAYVGRFVVLTEAQTVAVALWIAHTHALDASEATPYLNVHSAQFGSGKSRLLEVLEGVVARPWLVSATSVSALVRTLDTEKPTLLYDEWDETQKGDKEKLHTMLGILNAGYRRGGAYALTVPAGKNGWEVKKLDTFCPKVIAGVKDKLPDTTASRCIPIKMRRRLSNEQIEPYSVVSPPIEAEQLRARLAAWGASTTTTLLHKRPSDVPDQLGDRTQDVWKPLFVIADAAGGDWPKKSRSAAVTLHTEDARPDEERSYDTKLLADVRRAFEDYETPGQEEAPDKLTTESIIAVLATYDESPWREWWWNEFEKAPQKHAARRLADMLKPYDIRSKDIRTDDGTRKGYRREDFEDAWSRYLGSRGSSAD